MIITEGKLKEEYAKIAKAYIKQQDIIVGKEELRKDITLILDVLGLNVRQSTAIGEGYLTNFVVSEDLERGIIMNKLIEKIKLL